MTRLNKQLMDLARARLSTVQMSRLLYIACGVLAAAYYSAVVAMIGVILLWITETFEGHVSRRIIAWGGTTENRADRHLRNITISTALNAFSVVVFGWMAVLASPLELHASVMILSICAALFAAVFNHHIKQVLLVRFGVLGVGLLAIPIYDVWVQQAPLTSFHWLNLFSVFAAFGYVIDCSVRYHRMYCDNLDAVNDISASRDASDAALQRAAEAEKIAKFGRWEMSSQGDLLWSTEVHRIFNVTPEEFDGTTKMFFNRIHPADRETVSQLMAKALETREPFQCTHRVLWPDGTEITVRERAEIQFNNHGEPERMIGTVQDITEHVRAEQNLRRSQKMEAVGQLTGGVAHDFNNLLAVIQGNLELLKLSETSPEMADDCVDDALGAAKRGATLTRQLLSFGRRAFLAPQALNLNTVLAGLEALLRRTIPENIEIEMDFDMNLNSTKLDQSQLETAVVNLVLNARDAMPHGGVITLTTRNESLASGNPRAMALGLPAGEYVSLSITDTGVGMSDDIRERAFEPFFTTKVVGEGSGLGLSMVHGFVNQSGGSIQISSEQGAFTSVAMLFGITDELPYTVEKPGDVFKTARKLRILLVEDDEQLRSTLVRQIENLGYEVVEAANGDKAIAIFERDDTFDLVLSDVRMDGKLSGASFARAVRLKTPNMPVLFMSGDLDVDDMPDTEKVLLKPIQFSALAVEIREAIDGD